MIINCVYLLFIILLVILVGAILFEKTLKIEINLNHNHTNTNTTHAYKTETVSQKVDSNALYQHKELHEELKPIVKTAEDEQFEKQEASALLQVSEAMQIFQEVAEDEHKRT